MSKKHVRHNWRPWQHYRAPIAGAMKSRVCQNCPAAEWMVVNEGPMNNEAERMTREWPWWRVFWHRLKGHEITNDGPFYPPPVCRTCELARSA